LDIFFYLTFLCLSLSHAQKAETVGEPYELKGF
jgi:hypothetical protein